MPIQSISVTNFRGIGDSTTIPIKPITIFVGANSSGKSTVIHALAVLSQTVKASNDSRPLILDDDYAYVHLGRFIEVIHSKKYTDSITLGLTIDKFQFVELGKEKPEHKIGDLNVCYSFKSTTRTQKVSVECGNISIGQIAYEIKRKGEEYLVKNMSSGKSATTTFKAGFTLDESGLFSAGPEMISDFWPALMAQRHTNELLQKTLYLGPFRLPPLRQYPTRGAAPLEVGSQGEAAVNLLANEVMHFQNRPHMKQIAKWMQEMGIGKKLDVSRVAASHLFDVNVTLADNSSFPLADLGYGLSQVLPVLAQCSFAPDGATLLFEQPELHLHSLAVRPLAKVFIEAMREKNLKIVAETHSPELVGQFQRELRLGNLKLDEIAVYRVTRENGQTMVHPIQIDPDDFDIFERWERGLSVPE